MEIGCDKRNQCVAETGTLGILASYKSGLSSLRASGQDMRFLRYYIGRYSQAFDRIFYFSYDADRLEDFTQDPILLKRVRVLPKKWRVPAWMYAFLLPFAYPQEYKACSVFRVFQANGAPALWKSQTPSLVTFGYRYAEFARVEKKPAWKIYLLRLMERIAIWKATVLSMSLTKELLHYVRIPSRCARHCACS